MDFLTYVFGKPGELERDLNRLGSSRRHAPRRPAPRTRAARAALTETRARPRRCGPGIGATNRIREWHGRWLAPPALT